MNDTGLNPLVPDPHFNAAITPAGNSAGELSPYASFDLPLSDLTPEPQLDALRIDPEIAGYLQDNSPRAWTRQRLLKTGAGFILTGIALAALFFLLPGNMFRSYMPPAPRDTPKPQPYPDPSSLSILYRDNIRDINAAIGEGNRWRSVYDKLHALLADVESGKIEPPDTVLRWARQEMLVVLASKEIPPGSYPDTYPDEVFDGLTGILDQPEIPYRAGSAYARILWSRPFPREREAAGAKHAELTGILEALRAAHPGRLDNNRELLAIEAESHIRQFPDRYTAGDTYLDYHWRRAAHAILRLYELYGKRDINVRRIDRRRWQAVYRYFDLTLFTWDPKRIGRIRTARLDGVEYTREQVKKEIENL